MLSEQQRSFFSQRVKKTFKNDMELLKSASDFLSKKEMINKLYPLKNRYKIADFLYKDKEGKINILDLLNDLPEELR